MRIPLGFICSVLGAAVLSYLAIVTLIALPSDGPLRWFAVGGIAGLSLIVGVLVNGISMQEYFKVSRAYNTITTRLSPLLYSGIEDVLHRQKKTLKQRGNLNFLVNAPIDGYHRVVGATYPAEDPIRQHHVKFGEGTRGFLADRKVAGYARTTGLGQPKVEGNRPIFDRTGEILGEIPPLSEAGRPTLGKSGFMVGPFLRVQKPHRGLTVLSESFLFIRQRTTLIVSLKRRSFSIWWTLSQRRCRHIWMLYKSSRAKRSCKGQTPPFVNL